MPQTSQDPMLNEKWLMRAAWWVAHKQQLRNGFAAVVLFVSGAAILYSAYGFLDYWIFSRARDQQILQQLATSSINFSAITKPQPIGLSVPTVLSESAGNGHYDVLVKVVNPNKKWTADVTVHIASADQSQGVDESITLLDSDEQFLIAPGLASSSGSSAEAIVSNVVWHRLKNVADLDARKPKFDVTDVHFVSGPELKITGNTTVGQVTFSVANQSIFNFWSVDFTVVIMEGDNPVAAAKTTLTKFLSNEKRNVSINFYSDIPAATNVLVVPYVNVSDDSVFMQVPSKPIQFQ